MEVMELKDRIALALGGASKAEGSAQRLIYEFGSMVQTVEEWTQESSVVRVRAKAASFLSALCRKADELADQFFVPGYLLNAVGEVMAREDWLGRPVVDFVNTGLYFYGLDYIEKSCRNRAMNFMAAHSDLMIEYMSRPALNLVVAAARERFEAGRPFCLVHHYINALKKAYWAQLRRSDDVCDHTVELQIEESQPSLQHSEASIPTDEEALASTSVDRVQLMLRLFGELSEPQQRIYLWRHGFPGQLTAAATPSIPDTFESDNGSADSNQAGKETWVDVASRLGMTEKTAKREYLRALHSLLRESARMVFGDLIPSNYVRRILDTLRSVSQERDLRIKDNSGRGLGPLVQRWEIALRFVLNHNGVRVSNGPDAELRHGEAC